MPPKQRKWQYYLKKRGLEQVKKAASATADELIKTCNGEWMPGLLAPPKFGYPPKDATLEELEQVVKAIDPKWEPKAKLYDTLHLPLYDFPLDLHPFFLRMVPAGTHLSSFIIGQIFENKCRGLFSKDSLHQLFPFATKRGWIKRAYRPMGRAYKVRMEDGSLRYGLLAGGRHNHERKAGSVDAAYPWSPRKVDLTSMAWPPYLITPYMEDFPICSQDETGHEMWSWDEPDPFRMSPYQRGQAHWKDLIVYAKAKYRKPAQLKNLWPDVTEGNKVCSSWNSQGSRSKSHLRTQPPNAMVYEVHQEMSQEECMFLDELLGFDGSIEDAYSDEDLLRLHHAAYSDIEPPSRPRAHVLKKKEQVNSEAAADAVPDRSETRPPVETGVEKSFFEEEEEGEYEDPQPPAKIPAQRTARKTVGQQAPPLGEFASPSVPPSDGASVQQPPGIPPSDVASVPPLDAASVPPSDAASVPPSDVADVQQSSSVPPPHAASLQQPPGVPLSNAASVQQPPGVPLSDAPGVPQPTDGPGRDAVRAVWAMESYRSYLRDADGSELSADINQIRYIMTRPPPTRGQAKQARTELIRMTKNSSWDLLNLNNWRTHCKASSTDGVVLDNKNGWPSLKDVDPSVFLIEALSKPKSEAEAGTPMKPVRDKAAMRAVYAEKARRRRAQNTRVEGEVSRPASAVATKSFYDTLWQEHGPTSSAAPLQPAHNAASSVALSAPEQTPTSAAASRPPDREPASSAASPPPERTPTSSTAALAPEGTLTPSAALAPPDSEPALFAAHPASAAPPASATAPLASPKRTSTPPTAPPASVPAPVRDQTIMASENAMEPPTSMGEAAHHEVGADAPNSKLHSQPAPAVPPSTNQPASVLAVAQPLLANANNPAQVDQLARSIERLCVGALDILNGHSVQTYHDMTDDELVQVINTLPEQLRQHPELRTRIGKLQQKDKRTAIDTPGPPVKKQRAPSNNSDSWTGTQPKRVQQPIASPGLSQPQPVHTSPSGQRPGQQPSFFTRPEHPAKAYQGYSQRQNLEQQSNFAQQQARPGEYATEENQNDIDYDQFMGYDQGSE
ncbi:hypothetical protein BFW01_g5811 [Lasiodiplodia theobromae]|nr:hypothetical protein BFW01_g5811 [Lasiodiplodia theobromae]